MAHIGHPLVGDPVYGRARKPLSDVLKARTFARQALHAAHLGFIHPVTGNRIALDSTLPQDMRELIDELRVRSEEHTSELQSLMRITYAVFCLKKTTTTPITT